MIIERDQKTRRFAKGGRGGPGRKKLVEAQDRYKRETIAETAQALADDIPRLESELLSIDAAIAQAETTFVEALAPTLKARAEVDVTLSRARVAQHYVADPTGFGGWNEMPGDAALSEYREIRRQLEDAQRELADTTEPPYDRTEALGDGDRWAKVHAYETIRDRVNALLAEEHRARQKAESFGIAIPLLGTGATIQGDPFAPQRLRSPARQMAELL